MLNKLRWKFILVAECAVAAVMLLLILSINVGYRYVTNKSIDDMLVMLSTDQRQFPWRMDEERPGGDFMGGPGPGGFEDGGREPAFPGETPVEARFFIVRERDAGQTDEPINYGMEAQPDEAERLHEIAAKNGKRFGYADTYRFYRFTEDGESVYIFLNCARQQMTFKNLLLISVLTGLFAAAATFIILYFLSPRAIEPTVRNIEKQKRFITDASHEIKTPLTVISSYADMLYMEDEQDEMRRALRSETRRLSKLVNGLVLLSRWDEESPISEKSRFSLSEALWDTLTHYASLAKADGKKIKADISEELFVAGDEGAIQTALATLLENAVKYSAPDDTIEINARAKGRGILIDISNRVQEDNKPDLERIFDRFYRADQSRARSSGGTGVGLSIAKAIIEAHGGRIDASYTDEERICFAVSLPASD